MEHGCYLRDSQAFCNGRRLQIKGFKSFLIECTILTGCGSGETVCIPRIPMIPSEFPFQVKKLQFPVKIYFAMTINNVQGQILNVVKIDLIVQ